MHKHLKNTHKKHQIKTPQKTHNFRKHQKKHQEKTQILNILKKTPTGETPIFEKDKRTPQKTPSLLTLGGGGVWYEMHCINKKTSCEETLNSKREREKEKELHF